MENDDLELGTHVFRARRGEVGSGGEGSSPEEVAAGQLLETGGRVEKERSSSSEPTKNGTHLPLPIFSRMVDTVIHSGGCHCRRIRWQVEASPSVIAWSCNCSDCSMRGNTHLIVPSVKFKLREDSEQFLTTYTFGTHTAKHMFCKACGITSFYIPRSNPDGVAVTVKCIDHGTLAHIETRYFDGRNWESSYDASSISSFS